MAVQKKQVEDEGPGGAPIWMVTFSDCMTLLLTFFVLLLSFCSFKPKTLGNLATSFAKAMPSVGLSFTFEDDSVFQRQQVEKLEKIHKGTETPNTVQKKSSNYMREKKPLDFRDLKIFTVPSEKVFLGKGSVLSVEGRDVCNTLAVLIRSYNSRVVISENGPESDVDKSLERAYAVMKFMTASASLNKHDFNITASGSMRSGHENTRYLEITLLEKHVYE